MKTGLLHFPEIYVSDLSRPYRFLEKNLGSYELF